MLQDCLDSVFNTQYSNYEVIVVDNASTDGSRRMIEKHFAKVRLIKTSRNLGYAKGNNVGILNCSGDFVVLLNNDTIVEPSWLTKLVHEAVKNPNRFYQPKILLHNSKRINSAGNSIQLFGFAFPRGIGEYDNGQYEESFKTNYVSGACIFVSRKLVDEIGLLDESDLFTFYEDVNWGWRGILRGYSAYYVPSSTIHHKWGGSYGSTFSSSKFFLIERGRLATLLKNYSTRTLALMLPILFLIEGAILFYSLRKGFVSRKIRAYSDIAKNWDLLLEERSKTQKLRITSDAFVKDSFKEEIVHPYLGRSAILAKLLCSFSKFTKKFIV